MQLDPWVFGSRVIERMKIIAPVCNEAEARNLSVAIAQELNATLGSQLAKMVEVLATWKAEEAKKGFLAALSEIPS